MEQRGGPDQQTGEWAPYQGGPAYEPGPAPQPHAQSETAPTNIFAVLSLVAAIVGIIGVLPLAGSIIAIVFSVIARNELAKDPHQKGGEFATWGLIVGIVGLVLWVIIGVVAAFMSFLFSGFGQWGPWWRGW